MQVWNRARTCGLGGHEIEILVVAFNPIERGSRVRILAAFACEIAGTDPERDIGMPRHYPIERLKISV
jgi:hypothetical protein